MKRLTGIAVVIILVVTLAAIAWPVGATSEHGLVYSAALNEGIFSVHTLDRGEVKVWADGTVKVEIQVADANNVTYDVMLEYGAPIFRNHIKLGEITTDNKGHAMKFFDVNDIGGLPSPITQPGFAITKIFSPGPPPVMAAFLPMIPYEGP